MSTMQTELYDALIVANAFKDKARVVATAVAKSDGVATKAELYKALWIQGASIIGIMIALKFFA